jgi:hypothetical protein
MTMTARTESGVGLALPAAKALAHLMLVHEAVAHEWPITTESANAEIGEAVAHTRDLAIDENLITDELNVDIATWRTSITSLAANLTTANLADPDAPLTDVHQGEIEDAVRSTWNILALIDREITGLETQADPGNRP